MLKYKILHLPTATYMYYEIPLISDGHTLISQYEYEINRYTLGNMSMFFNSREQAIECLHYWYANTRNKNRCDEDAFIFSATDIYYPVNRAHNFIMEHFEIVEVNDDEA